MKFNTSRTVQEILTSLAYVIDIENNIPNYHSWRVAVIATHIAARNAAPKDLRNIFYAGLLHDIGGVGLPLHILHYLTSTDKNTYNLLLSHPIIGAQIVAAIPQMNPCAKIILDHHEWTNGQGYPRAKMGKDISRESLIVRLADSIDTLFQTNRTATLHELKKTLAMTADKEFPRKLYALAMEVVKRDKLFTTLSHIKEIPKLFTDTQNRAGMLKVKSKIDAVGTTLEAVSQTIDMRHPFTSGHSLRVSRYALSCALAMRLPHDDITRIKWAGLIHDIGKLNVPRKILDKPTGLTPEEFLEVKKHAQMTHSIMQMIPSLEIITPVASSHHEHFDGSGYPQGLRQHEIPLGARILTICDSFDAMTSNRPYRNPLTPDAACEELRKNAGTQFDPDIVKQVLPLFMNLGL